VSTYFEWGAGELDGSLETLDEQQAYGTNGEASYEQEGYEQEGYEQEGYEQEGYDQEGYGQQESTYGGQYGEVPQEAEGVFDEAEEMELAADLLSLGSEAELDESIRKLIRSAARAVNGTINRDVGSALGGAIKSVAQDVVPVMGAPPAAAGEVFGIETEGLSGEDEDFEVMRRFVRFAGAAAGRASRAARGVNPRAIARSALVSAARRLAPGILRRWGSRHRGPQWHRRRRHGWRGMRDQQGFPPPGYGYPGYPPYQPPYGAPGMPNAQQGAPGPDPSAAPAGLGGAGAQAAPSAPGMGMSDSGAEPDAAAGPEGPLPQTGRWTRQGGQLTIHL
jgi:hypothetical protein